MQNLKEERNFVLFVGKQLAKVSDIFSAYQQGKFDPIKKEDGAIFMHRRFQVNCDAMEYLPENIKAGVKENVGSARFEGEVDLMVITWDRDNPAVGSYESGLFPKFEGHLVITILGDDYKIPARFEVEEETYWTGCNCKYKDDKLKLIVKEMRADLIDSIQTSFKVLKGIG